MAKLKKGSRYNLGADNVLFKIKTTRDLDREIATFKREGQKEHYLSLIPKIINVRKDAFDLICNKPRIQTYDEFYKGRVLKTVEIERELFWQAAILATFSHEINAFCEDMRVFHKRVLLGPLVGALADLEVIITKYGLSSWAIENKIALIGMTEGADGIKKYTNSIINTKDIEPFFVIMVEKLGDRAISSVSWKRYDSIINTLTQELKDAKKSDLSDYIVFKLNLYMSNFETSIFRVLESETRFSIIDRYLSFLRCLQFMCSYRMPSLLEKCVLKATEYLDKKIDDYLLNNIIRSIDHGAKTTDQSTKVLSAFDFYATGDYENCKQACEELFHDDPTLSELYEIYVKSLFRLNKSKVDFAADSFLNKILNLMLAVLPKNEISRESYNELMKFIYVFSSHQYMANVFNFCCKEMRFYTDPQYVTLQLFSELNSFNFSPIWLASYHAQKYHSESVGFMNSVFKNDLQSLQNSNVPDYRLKRYTAIIHETTRDYNRAFDLYSDLEQSDDYLSTIEALVGKSNLLFKSGQYKECLDYIVEAFLKAPLIIYKLPVKQLLDFVEKTFDSDLYENVNLLIVYDIYVKNISSDKLAKMCDAYDEFVFRNNMQSPLDIFSNSPGLDPRQTVYFLRFVCIPSVIDISDSYKIHDDVLSERIKICLKLQEIDQENYSIYANEVEEILSIKAIIKTASKIGTGRIFVDTAGIIKFKRNELNELFKKYIALPDDPDADGKLIQYDISGETYLPGSKKDQLLVSIFEELRNEFINNRYYGLDGNLSLEIRHGQLENLFWVPLEKLNLVTKKDEQGNFKRNKFWWNVYEIVKFEHRTVIDQSLKEFSKDIDEMIEYIKKEWFVVRAGSGPFSFSIQEEDLRQIKSRVEGITNIDGFLETLSQILIDITDENLKDLRIKINSEATKLFDSVFAHFYDRLMDIKNRFVLTELDTCSSIGRNEIHKSVDELSSLLEFANKHSSPDFQISLPLTLSIEAITATYSHRQLRFETDCSESTVISGTYLHDFIRIFLTLFDNIVRHSSFDIIPPVSLKITSEGEWFSILVCNSVNSSKDILAIKTKLSEIKQTLKTKSYFDSVNKEGKTGIYKIDKLLTVNIGFEHDLDFYISDDFHFTFFAKIKNSRLSL